MSSKTKIVVLRMKEIIYTGIFVGLAILLVTLCLIMCRPCLLDTSRSTANRPGYTESTVSTPWPAIS